MRRYLQLEEILDHPVKRRDSARTAKEMDITARSPPHPLHAPQTMTRRNWEKSLKI